VAVRTQLLLRAKDVLDSTGRPARNSPSLARSGRTWRNCRKYLAATAVARGERAAQTRRYGANPASRSHREVFLALQQTLHAPNGLSFLDEPETPLSPTACWR
jgi:predicted ATPase